MKILLLFAALALAGCDTQHPVQADPPLQQKASFGAGCFWCSEAMFEELNGVDSVVAGYAGGTMANPTYEQVASDTTGYAEAAQIYFDPAIISYDELLEIFWQTHDPTHRPTPAPDDGSQYRSVIFYHDEMQRALAEDYRRRIDSAGIFDYPVVTEIVPVGHFYRAEDYHQNFYDNNPENSYCRAVVTPKLEKFRALFASKLKKK